LRSNRLRFCGHNHGTINIEISMNKRNNLQFTICNLQFAIFLIVFLTPSFVIAHNMEIFATVEGKTIQGKASFHDGTPARNADVKAFDAAGEEIGRTKTDDQGKFSLAARFRCDHRLLVDTGDGHGVEYTILAKSLPADLPPHGPAIASADSARADSESDLDHSHDSALLKVIHADVDALQDQLDQYEHRIRFRDILGGIGFIVGLTGAAYGYYYRGLLRNKTQSGE
jgi:nickel transport protein